MKKLGLIISGVFIVGLLGLFFVPRSAQGPIVIEKIEEKRTVEPKYFSYVINTKTSFNSLKERVNKLDGVYAQAGYIGSDGKFGISNSVTQKEILEWIKKNEPAVSLHAWVNNYSGGWQGEAVDMMFANPGAIIDELVIFTKEYGYDGLSLDFESLPDQAYSKLPLFLSQLSSKLSAEDKTLSIHFYLDDLKAEYDRIAPMVDQVIIMAYDEHDSTTSAGPVASVPWIEEHLNRITLDLSSEKLILGLGNYGYDWSGGKARSISVPSAISIQSEIQFDEDEGNAWYAYTDTKGIKHEVWFLEKRSVQASIEKVSQFNPYGYGIFRLGSEDPGVWDIFGK